MANGRPGRPKGLPKTGGRKKGSGDKATAALVELCQTYTAEAIHKIVSIMRTADKSGDALGAARELLDRGHGKAVQFSEAKIEHRSVLRTPAKAENTETWQEQHAPQNAVH